MYIFRITDTYHYVYTDHLGSILTATKSNSVVEFEQNFDAWGRSRHATTWSYTGIPVSPAWLYRGYTGHEHLPQFGIINMNGRLYDPIVGRMLSPDNNVQMPDYTQNYNRYSYALNNPLKYTDPDGEFISLAAIGIGMLISAATYTAVHLVTHEGSFDGWNWGAFAGAAVAGGVGGFVSPALTAAGIGGFANGAITGAATGFAANLTTGIWHGDKFGSIITSSFKGALIGAVIGGVIQGTSSVLKGNRFSDGAKLIEQKVLADQSIPSVTQKGNNNCLPASAEAVDGSFGGNISQDNARSWFPGTSAETDPISMRDFWKAYEANSGHTVSGLDPSKIGQIHSLMNSGERITIGLNLGGSVGHSVVLDNVVSQSWQKVNGQIVSKILYNAMNPATSLIQSYSSSTVSNAFGLVRIFP